MKIAVVGMGYVGLSIACLLAQRHEVCAVDIVQSKVDLVNSGKSPIKDKEIEEVLSEGSLSLSATTHPEDFYQAADFIIVSTPTNYDDELNHFDTRSIESVLDLLSGLAVRGCVVIKSTVPVGYTEDVSKRYPSLNILFSPEFLREGHALCDNLHPSRIVVGIPFHDEKLQLTASRFADLLEEGSDEIAGNVNKIIVGSTEAEAIKLFANTYLALRVSFFNELDTYAEMRGLRAREIIRGVCLDPRIGSHYNNPSFGYGGYCLPKDTKQLLANYDNVPQNLIRAIVDSNATRKRHVAQRILERSPKVVGIYRLVMKEGSDNFRQSSILDIMQQLSERGVELIVFEPLLSDDSYLNAKKVDSLSEFKRKSDVIVCNRTSEDLNDVLFKVYSRDLWHRDS